MDRMRFLSRHHVVLNACWMLLALAALAAPAAAQSASGEIAGGYSYLRVDGEGLPEGWFVSGAVDLTPDVSIVGEVFSNARNLSTSDLAGSAGPAVSPDAIAFADLIESAGIEAGLTVRSLSGGIRYGRSHGRAGWFVQSLAGPAWVNMHFSLQDIDVSTTPTTWIWQSGGGVDVSVARRLAVRLRGDYRRLGAFDLGGGIFGQGAGASSEDFTVPGANGFVFSTGLVFRLGALRQP